MNSTLAKHISLFETLTPQEIDAVLAAAQKVSFEKDQDIIRQGSHHGSLYIVESGVLHVRRQTGSSQVLLGRIEKGGFFGEIGLFDPGAATASIRAMDKGSLWEIRKENFETILEKHPSIGCRILRAMMQEMAKRLRRVDQRLSDSVYWGAAMKP